jgi:hypothetical protein
MGVWVTLRSVWLPFLFAALALTAAVTMACEKSNAVVVQEQIEESQRGCSEGCEAPPPGCAIKGNISEAGNRFYHVPGGEYYDGIIIQLDKGERWFCTEAEAVNNGYTRSFR